jgi:hypothetical protein
MNGRPDVLVTFEEAVSRFDELIALAEAGTSVAIEVEGRVKGVLRPVAKESPSKVPLADKSQP